MKALSLIVIGSILIMSLSSCGGSRDRNVVLIIIDTLAAEHLSCYGYHRETSPFIDSLASHGTLYARTQAQAPWTLPSMVTIYTGVTPRSHGCTYRDGFVWGLDPELKTLPQFLGEAGYATAAFVNITYLGPNYGMAKGFDTFSIPENEGHGRAAETVLEAVEWMESENFEEPFLMVFHVFDPHLPYEPPTPYDTFYCDEGLAGHTEWRADETGAWYPQQRQHMIDLYNGEIRWTDSQIGTLLAELRRRGLEDRTLVILTADHGEEFLEHGHWGHGPNLYQQSLHVPLIFSGPEIESRVDSTIVGQYDILPTVLDYCGIDVPGYIEGVSLLAQGPVPERPVPSSAVIRRNDDTVFASVRQLNMKAIWSPVGDSSEFYDLGSDPLEQDPAPTDSMLLEEVLLYWASPCICEPTELERERIQARLRGLGYID